MNKGYWYFAHPYTNHYQAMEEYNAKNCAVLAARLMELGYCVYSPILHCHPMQMILQQTWEYWMEYDKLVIERTQFAGIIMGPGWEKSKGCRAEKELFEQKGLPVLYYSEMMKAQEVEV